MMDIKNLSRGKAECMHASIACLLFYEDYVWASLGNAMKAKQSKAWTSNDRARILAGFSSASVTAKPFFGAFKPSSRYPRDRVLLLRPP
jgi:hypothetical protein